MTRSSGYAVYPNIGLLEWIPWLTAIAVFFLLPEYLPLGARVLIYILFALSLDLVFGYAGIITLGHSAFFGFGAYTAGILSVRYGVTDPALQLLGAALAASVFGFITGAVILRTRGLAVLMLTLAITMLCLEVANRAIPITGGADGLSGIVVAPILGLFRFDFSGKTAYIWSLCALFLGWWLIRRLIYSPFGATLVGIRENTVRMQAIGSPVYWRLVAVYGLSAGVAGAAGALLTQTNQFVGLNVFGVEPAGELLIMLILGGVGRIYGAFVGPVVYLIAQDYLAKQFPEYWYLGIGTLLVVVVLFARGGVLGIVDSALSALRRDR